MSDSIETLAIKMRRVYEREGLGDEKTAQALILMLGHHLGHMSASRDALTKNVEHANEIVMKIATVAFDEKVPKSDWDDGNWGPFEHPLTGGA